MKPILCFLLLGGSWALAHAETTFTYQGRLGSAGQPANGPHDFELWLYEGETSGDEVDSTRAVTHDLPMP